MTSDRVAAIEAILTNAFSPTDLLIKDQSHLHAGHAGARDGRGHFAVRIVSEQFRDVSPIQRHRMIYDALGSLMETDIHALRIDAAPPSEDPQ
ncbi:MAG: BolA family protein [Pseudomonadota bacterium]